MYYDFEFDKLRKVKALDSTSVFDCKQDSKGFLWITTQSGLFKFNTKTKEIEHHFHTKDKRSKFPTDKLTDLVIDEQDRLWIGTADTGLILFDTENERWKLFEPKTNHPSLCYFTKIRRLTFDLQGQLWLGSYDNGIAVLDTLRQTFSFKRANPQNHRALASNTISRIYCDKSGTIWVCCQNGKLNRYDHNTGIFNKLDGDPLVSTALSANSVSAMVEDRSGNRWIGSHGNGIFLLNKQKNCFKSYNMLTGRKHSLPGNVVSSFTELGNGKIILSTDGGGICVFDRKSETFETFNEQNGLSSNAVTKLIKEDDQTVWIATWGGGLSKFNLQTRKFENFLANPKDKFSLVYNNLKDVVLDGKTTWVVTHGEGVVQFNTETKKFISHKSGIPTPFDYYKPTWGNSLLVDSKKRIWFSTSASLLLYDGKKLQYFNDKFFKQRKNSSDFINMTLEDHSGQIWIVTDRGIDRYDEVAKKCIQFEGVPDLPQNPQAMVEDLNHNLWISSSDGLSCLNAARNKIRHYSTLHGLPGKEFVPRAAFRLKDGTLLFGGTFGFVLFHPDSLHENSEKPTVLLTELRINQQVQQPGSSVLPKALQAFDTLELTYNQDIITLELVGLDFSNPDILGFSYQLAGFNDQWLPLDQSRTLTIPNLAPGSYALRIKATKNGKEVAVVNPALVLIIHPRWWMTWWFKILIVVLLIGIVSLIIYFKTQSLKKRQQHLEKLVELRTESLHSTLTSLNEAKQIIEVKNVELAKTVELKDKLIGIIGHDFKGPLTALTGLIDLIDLQLHTIQKEKLSDYIQRLNDTARKISNQLIMMTDWAQARQESIDFIPKETDLVSLINTSLGLVKESARQKNIQLSLQAHLRNHACADPRMIQTVILNLLSNAIKFTASNGTILVVVQEASHMHEVSIIDTGIGMDEHRVEEVLNSKEIISTRGTKGENGFGFGLQICKHFIEVNGGIFSIKSKPGLGSNFMFSIPIGNTPVTSVVDEKSFEFDDENYSENPSEEKQFSILLIDDDENLLELLHQAFVQDCKVYKAVDGKSGLHLAQHALPDLVLCDIRLPGISGLEVCHFLKEDPVTCHIPVLLVSGERIAGLESESFANGANDFIEKPFNLKVLKQKVLALLENLKVQKQKTLQQNPSISFSLPESADDVLMKKMLDLLNDKWDNADYQVDSIAHELGLSRTQLWRKTKSVLGKSPSELFSDLRLQKAHEMLACGKYRISDIAYHVGFTDPRYFSRSFTKKYGMSPLEFAKQVQKKEVS
jgi:signal transduction histidine kinase/ligand-binding sensor domain-containing protein/AraC-like DNA-binding protein/CheY-like chemotaxis protein